jgi:acyl-CoA synthetase (AMP-forming)/AMP-acid ligase II
MSALIAPATPAAALEHQARIAPDAVALEFPEDGTRATFAEWDRAATALAGSLHELGLVPGDRVALLAENRLEWPIVQIAVARAGLVLVPLNTHLRHDELLYALKQSEARMVVLTEQFRSNPFLDLVRQVRSEVAQLEHMVLIGGDNQPDCLPLASLLHGSSQRPLAPVSADDPCAIIYTSGTTGRPKGAVLAHGGVMANGDNVFARLGITEADTVTSIVPMFHSASFCTAISGCLATGARYVGCAAFDAVGMMRLIEQTRATVHISVPTTLRAMLNHPERSRFDLSSLRVGTCGGADSDPKLLSDCAVSFPIPGLVHVYGLTEASALATCSEPDSPHRFDTAGAPLPGYEIRIVSTTSAAELCPGESGEVQILTRYRMSEYFRMPEATVEAFTDDGWLRTGDIGTLTEAGELLLTGGRLKDMIIRGGENIYPVEIENVLLQHAGVRQAAVFGLSDAELGERVAAAVSCDPATTDDELAAYCKARLARFKVPSVFFAVDEFPLTASGKVKKNDLRQMAHSGDLRPLREAVQ